MRPVPWKQRTPARLSVARLLGRRGAGLGNEVFALAKARIAADILDARVLEQPWWLNPRRYGADLGYNVWPPVYCRLRRMSLPVIRLGVEDVDSVFDYESSMRLLGEQLPEQWVLVHESGMTGGYLGIRSARGFLMQRLGVPPPPPASEGLLRVGIHYRAGDFSEEPVRPGVFNARLSPRWVCSAMASVAGSWDGHVEFILHTDAVPDDPAVRELARELPGNATVRMSRGRVLEDLRSLAACDVIVPSVSSFSMLAIFLSDALYVWPREQLVEQSGWLSIWGTDERVVGGPMAAHRAAHEARGDRNVSPRGMPLATNEAIDLTAWLALRNVERAGGHPQESDLLYYGVVRAQG